MANTTVTVSDTDATTVTVSSVAPDATSIRGVAISATAPTAGQAIMATSATAAAWTSITTDEALDVWPGTTNVVTLGTVTTGTWSATAIATTKGGTGLTSYVLGDLPYASAANTLAALAGNTTTTRKFLRQTGDGAISAAPAWDTVTKTDVGLSAVENTALSTWAGSGNITTLGTVASGTWSATAIAATKGGTGLSTFVLGDVLYASVANVLAALAGNTTTTRKFLRQTGTGAASVAPAWDTVTKADVGLTSVEDTALSTWAGSANVVTLGTVTTGTWSATAIGPTKGGTGLATYVLGDTLYASATNVLTALAGNATTTRKFLLSVGDGANAAAPSWDTVTKADVGLSVVENTALSTWAGSTAITTLGTIATGTVPAANVSAGLFGAGDYTVTGKVVFAGTPTLTDASVGVTAANGLTVRAIAGSTYDFAVLRAGVGTVTLGISGTTVTVPGDVTISGGRLYVQGTGFASIIDRALQVGNGGLTSGAARLTVDGTTTAASGAAQHLSVIGTLIAAANNDSLYGAQIAPAYTPGAFTGLTLYGLKIGDVAGGATAYSLYTGTGAVRFGGLVTGVSGFSGALTGNADTATALATARAINGVDFDGTSAITVTAAAGTLSGTTLAAGVTASSLTSLGTIASLVATTADINGGTIDATAIGGGTPAAGAFTTGAFSGDLAVATSKFTVAAATGNTVVAGTLDVAAGITSTLSASASPMFTNASVTTGQARFVDIQNTSGRLLLGIESSAGGGIITGAPAYATALASQTATSLCLGANGVLGLTIASTGAATFASSLVITGDAGFYGQAATAKPTGVAVSAEGIHAALVTLNLIAA